MKTQKAHEYRLKYGLEMPSAKLARILYSENPLLYKDMAADKIKTISLAFRLIQKVQRKLLEAV